MGVWVVVVVVAVVCVGVWGGGGSCGAKSSCAGPCTWDGASRAHLGSGTEQPDPGLLERAGQGGAGRVPPVPPHLDDQLILVCLVRLEAVDARRAGAQVKLVDSDGLQDLGLREASRHRAPRRCGQRPGSWPVGGRPRGRKGPAGQSAAGVASLLCALHRARLVGAGRCAGRRAAWRGQGPPSRRHPPACTRPPAAPLPAPWPSCVWLGRGAATGTAGWC